MKARLKGFPVHPRACGEYDDIEAVENTGVRFTPAPAGNTYRSAR